MNTANELGTGNIRKLVWSLAIPSMLAQFVSVLYSIVDRMYIGNIAQSGQTALAGVGICGPIVTLIAGFGTLIGVGGAPLMSIKLGEKNPDGARKVLSNCFLMLLIVSVITMTAALLLKDKLLVWFGASEATLPYARQYLTVYLTGTVFALVSVGLNLFVICQGYAKTGMLSVLLGAMVNIALDPLFIFVFHMGVTGAALATVLSQALSAIFVVIFLLGKRVPIRITFGGYQPRLMRRVLTVGVSPFIIVATDSVMLICLNASLAKFGGGDADMLITCATILQSLMLVITLPLGGITSGTQTVLGFNYGARQSARVLQAEKHILILCFLFTTIMFILAQTLSPYFVRIFTRDETLIRMTVRAIRIFTLAIIPLSLQYTFVDGLTGMSVTHIAIILSMFRKGLFLVLVFALPAVWGAQSIFYSEPIADAAAAVASSLVFGLSIRKILRKRELAQDYL